MSTKAIDKAWCEWEGENLDKDSFEIGFYEGSIAARRITLLHVVVPFFVGSMVAATITWVLS